ncbi:YceI family protein [Brevibacterium casei]|uniref:YceI family protein n=1 Tax=Brevibacterium casei TaxID=33889 RepID=UPI003EBB2B92
MTHSRPFFARPLVWIIALAAALVIIAAIVGTRMYASSQNASAPEEFLSDDVAEATDSTGSAAAGEIAGQWSVGEGSEAGYRVDEVLNGEDVTVVGRTDDVTGDVTISGTALTEGAVAVDLTTVTTDNSRRDGYFTSQAIDTSTYPEATFTVAEAVDLSALADSGTAEIEIPGALEINGQSRETTATSTVSRTDSGLAVAGAIDVTWQDHGVTPPNLGFVSVEGSGVVEFSLALTRD